MPDVESKIIKIQELLEMHYRVPDVETRVIENTRTIRNALFPEDEVIPDVETRIIEIQETCRNTLDEVKTRIIKTQEICRNALFPVMK